MINIDEAIKIEENISDVCEEEANMCDLDDSYERSVAYENSKIAKGHKQIAEWLKELKKIKEQEPCEDCVSRKSLLDNYNGVETPVGYRKVVDFEVIKNMPSVTPTRKKGKWIKHKDYYDCSLCSCLAPCTETADSFIWKLSNYCPDCGAEMNNDFIKL